MCPISCRRTAPRSRLPTRSRNTITRPPPQGKSHFFVAGPSDPLVPSYSTVFWRLDHSGSDRSLFSVGCPLWRRRRDHSSRLSNACEEIPSGFSKRAQDASYPEISSDHGSLRHVADRGAPSAIRFEAGARARQRPYSQGESRAQFARGGGTHSTPCAAPIKVIRARTAGA